MDHNTTLRGCKDFSLGQCQRKELPINVTKEASVSSCQAVCNQINANQEGFE